MSKKSGNKVARKKADTKSESRISTLDLLRGIAVILMVQQHTGYWFWESGGSMGTLLDRYPVMVTANGLGGLAAPVFICLAGIGATLGYGAGRSDRQVFLRGIVVIALGYMLNILTPAWFAPWSWYVLHLIGFGLCISPLFRRASSPFLITLFFLIVLATPALLTAFNMPRYFSNTFMRGSFSAAAISMLPLCGGNFPIFPWAGLFAAGLVSGRWILQGTYMNLLKLSAALIVTGLLLLMVKQGHFKLLDNMFGSRLLIINLYMYPAYPMQFLALSAVSLFLTWCALAAGRRSSIAGKSILVMLGRVSLTVFIVHIIAIRNFMVYSGLWQTFSMPVTIALQLLVIAVIMLLVYHWNRYGFRYGFEWLIRKIR